MHLISKYSSPAEASAKLSNLGTGQWLNTRNKAKSSIKKLTMDLLQIYATRRSGKQFVYEKDNVWQEEFESAFPYEATPDQKEAIRAVKSDMQSEKAMDRLVCGDVGYGKTEVAMRAAFKAIVNGKQVALLAPTTILAEQHYKNFASRIKPFPFSVDMLSRFRSRQEQKETVQKLEQGTVDIVIGTHRLLQKDIKFKDLGLLIIDEEQRFGVEHKEKLKNLKKNVDVLSLSATPIPRTLHMSLSGIWDVSMITTPPPGRTHVATSVLPWSEKVVKQAIEREIERGGQIFYVHNRVETIGSIAAKINALFPLLKITVAHGQMDEIELEKKMTSFIEGKQDILVCTTIIESGLDIPNVNTIIIDNPERFGLSTLYQLRGRVGRSSVKAYAYLLYKDGAEISEKATDRLSAIKSFTALGSGYKIALRDLEIRGAGNVLGAEQHGHMLSIGFDLYCELLQEASAELKGEKPKEARVALIDLHINAFIPDGYIVDKPERISVYKRLNLAVEESDLSDIQIELKDRFGKYPKEVENLFMVIKIKIQCQKIGINKIHQTKNVVYIESASNKYNFRIEGMNSDAVLARLEKILNKAIENVS